MGIVSLLRPFPTFASLFCSCLTVCTLLHRSFYFLSLSFLSYSFRCPLKTSWPALLAPLIELSGSKVEPHSTSIPSSTIMLGNRHVLLAQASITCAFIVGSILAHADSWKGGNEHEGKNRWRKARPKHMHGQKMKEGE